MERKRDLFEDRNEFCWTSTLIKTSAQAFGLHLFPQIFLIVVQLARQSINRKSLLRAKLSPKNEPQVVLTSGI